MYGNFITYVGANYSISKRISEQIPKYIVNPLMSLKCLCFKTSFKAMINVEEKRQNILSSKLLQNHCKLITLWMENHIYLNEADN